MINRAKFEVVPQAVSEELKQTHRQRDKQTDRIALYILDMIWRKLTFTFVLHLQHIQALLGKWAWFSQFF